MKSSCHKEFFAATRSGSGGSLLPKRLKCSFLHFGPLSQ